MNKNMLYGILLINSKVTLCIVVVEIPTFFRSIFSFFLFSTLLNISLCVYFLYFDPPTLHVHQNFNLFYCCFSGWNKRIYLLLSIKECYCSNNHACKVLLFWHCMCSNHLCPLHFSFVFLASLHF